MKCPNCGTENKPETMFCEICGAALPQPEKPPVSPPMPIAPELESKPVPEPSPAPAPKTAPQPKPEKTEKQNSAADLLLKKSINVGGIRIPLAAAGGGVIAILAVVITIIVMVSSGGGRDPVTKSGIDFGGGWYEDFGDDYNLFYFEEEGILTVYYYDGYIAKGEFTVKGENINCAVDEYEFTLYPDGDMLYFEDYTVGYLLTRFMPEYEEELWDDEWADDELIYDISGAYYRNNDPEDWCLNFYSEDYMEIIDPVNGATDWVYTIDDDIILAGTGEQLKVFIIVDEDTLKSNEGNFFYRIYE